MAISNLTGQKTYQSFRNLMQISSSGQVFDGLGNLVTSLQLTSSFASGSTSGGSGAGFPFTGFAVITGSLLVSSSLTVTGSIRVQGSITGSLFGTASWAQNAVTASSAATVAITDSVLNQTYLIGTSAQRDSINRASTALYYITDNDTLISPNFSAGELGTGNIYGNLTGNVEGTASFAVSASWAPGGSTFPYTGSALITGSLGITGSLDVSGTITGSSLRIENNTYLDGTLRVTNDTQINGDITIQSATPNLKLRDTSGGGFSSGYDLRVDTGSFQIYDDTHNRDVLSDIFNTGSQKHTTSLTSEIIIISGSDSVSILGNTSLTGSLNVLQGITGSLQGTASNAISSSHALTASYIPGSIFTSINSALSASHAISASHAPSYLPLIGGTLTGNLTIQKPVATLNLTSTVAGGATINLTANSTGEETAVINSTTAQGGSGDLVFKAASTERIRIKGNTPAVIISGSLIVSGSQSISAPIYYNLGSTTYYVNPSATSRMFTIDAVSQVAAGLDMRAPIFYDSTNTMYYVSPDSTSRLQNLDVLGILNVTQGNVLGILNVTQGITGSLFGTASQSVSSSYALTASYALNGGGGGGAAFPFTGSARITGSLNVIGPVTITGSFAQGAAGNRASGQFSHAQGSGSRAVQYGTHAEGSNTYAEGLFAHTEGNETTASGYHSHAEGGYSDFDGTNIPGGKALGNGSHAEGFGTIALGDASHAQGKYNISTPGEGAFIVGNGTDNNNRSNLIYAAGNEVQITGSLKVSGSLLVNGVAPGGGASFPYTGSAIITGSLIVTGSTTSTQGFIKPGAGAVYLLADGSTTAGTGGSPFPFTGDAQITGSLQVQGSATFTGPISASDYQTTWTDYSSTSTIAGWSVFTRKSIRYQTIGTLAYVAYDILGTSNSGSATITLPWNVGSPSALQVTQSNTLHAVVGTTTPGGQAVINSGSNVVTFLKYSTATAFSAWTTTGVKGVRGVLILEIP